MRCEKCGEEISERRLAVLPDTLTCVKCSVVKRVIGVRASHSKSDYDTIIVHPENANHARYAQQENGRGFQRLCSGAGMSFKERDNLNFL
jgi:hypothetical protein